MLLSTASCSIYEAVLRPVAPEINVSDDSLESQDEAEVHAGFDKETPAHEPEMEPKTGTEAGRETGTATETDTEMQAKDEVTPPVFGFIDAHADTLSRARLPQHNAGLYSNNLHVDFRRLHEFGAPVQVFVLWCADRFVADAFDYTNSLIDFLESEVGKHSDIIEIALSLEDLERNARNNKISAVLSIEGGEALMGKLENLDHFYNRGVRIMSLTWNRENELGYGQATGSDEGLKPFGVEVLQRMEELGIILDVSHLNRTGFWDAHRLSTRPYMASHSNASSVTPHNRNLTDDQIRAVADSGGVIGIALYPPFLSRSGNVSMGDIMSHIRHFIDLGAGDNLGLGGDLDGFNTMPAGLTCVSSYKVLAEEIANVFGNDASSKIMSGNFYNFFVRYF